MVTLESPVLPEDDRGGGAAAVLCHGEVRTPGRYSYGRGSRCRRLYGGRDGRRPTRWMWWSGGMENAWTVPGRRVIPAAATAGRREAANAGFLGRGSDKARGL